MPGFVEGKLSAVGQADRREEPPAFFGDVPRHLGSPGLKFGKRGMDVIAHQVELMMAAAVGRVHRELGRRQREDRPASARVDRAHSQHVCEEPANVLGLGGEDDSVHASDHAAIVAAAVLMDCYSCAGEAEFDRLPPRERVAGDELWRVAHAIGTAVPGWLVLLPRRHVTSVAALSDAEASSLGTWQVRISRALHVVMGCEKTYVAQFAEAEGFAHVHFHIIPRPADLPAALRGPKIFGALGADGRTVVSEQAMDDIAARLARALAA